MQLNKAVKYKVLHVIRQGLIGGGESHVLTLVDKLDKTEVQSFVLSFTNGPMVDRLKRMDIPVVVVPVKHPFDSSLFILVRKQINEWGINLIHAHGSRACAFMLPLSLMMRIKMAYTVHGWSFHPEQSLLIRSLRKTYESIITRFTTQNICVSEANVQSGKSLYPGFNATVVRYGIDLKRFSTNQDFVDYRQEWGVPTDAKLILFAARMTVQKQPLVALEAFDYAASLNPDIYLVMVGGGELLEDVKKKIETLACRDRIKLKPFYTDMPGVLHAADIFILPSLWEGLPIALLEAMAMGKVVLATAVDGTKELIEHKVNGMLLDVSDHLASDLGKSIIDVTTDDLFLAALSSQARVTIERTYDSERMACRMKEVYQDCLNK
jgi:glycosyltransferase involved in cell wall biosynthesis